MGGGDKHVQKLGTNGKPIFQCIGQKSAGNRFSSKTSTCACSTHAHHFPIVARLSKCHPFSQNKEWHANSAKEAAKDFGCVG